ncbi:hypothetical protein B296_00052157, partial [Ensete ventricosum]
RQQKSRSGDEAIALVPSSPRSRDEELLHIEIHWRIEANEEEPVDQAISKRSALRSGRGSRLEGPGGIFEYFVVCGIGPEIRTLEGNKGFQGTEVMYMSSLLDQYPPSNHSLYPPPPPQLPTVCFIPFSLSPSRC